MIEGATKIPEPITLPTMRVVASRRPSPRTSPPRSDASERAGGAMKGGGGYLTPAVYNPPTRRFRGRVDNGLPLFHSLPSSDPRRPRCFFRLPMDRPPPARAHAGRRREHGRRPREGARVELPGREAQPPDRVLSQAG